MRRTTLAIAGAFTLAAAAIAAPPALAAEKVTITLAADRTTVDADHRDATITGMVTAGAENKPVAGVKVDLSSTGQPNIEDPTTDAEGKFTATYSSPGFDDQITATTGATDELETGTAGPLPIKAVRSKTRMTIAAPGSAQKDAGVPFTLSGLVEYESAEASGTWKPLAGAQVNISFINAECNDDFPVPGSVTTGKDGQYAKQVKLPCGSAVNANASIAEPWFETAYTALRNGVIVRPRSSFRDVKVTMDPYGLVKASGAAATSPVYREFYGKQILLERSWNGRNWWTHKTLRAGSYGRVSTQFTVNRSSYWRFRFAGTTDAMPATSKSIKTWRWTTKMSKISVSPRKVRKLKYVTAKGSLVRYSPTSRKFVAYGGQNVRIIFRYKGKKTWYHLAWAKTDRKGRFSKKVRAYGDGYYAALFHGAANFWATGSPNDKYVDTYGLPGSQRQAGVQSFLTPFTPPVPAPNGTGGTTRVG
ncbi:Ig-like domain-containing protein [Actinomadura rudentiformis]|uniref:Carboxypeptidase regulatory-like domain-containing protein n=1 Tax=Actinomadura rudentiformis TaxID=359158 RepID=A0A6H9YSE3_9ACTN|nr:hypothetical protein [Actinomadura rudentiformis]KAB2344809.1 hypothetical protein F8566_29895 [Actinomadura rudentiformis]